MNQQYYNKVIAESEYLKCTSEKTYRQVEQVVRENIRLSDYELAKILCDFGINYHNSKTRKKQFNKIKKIVQIRVSLDDAVNEVREWFPLGYK